ncbi:MAG: arginine transporter [Pseudomonadota bacterium]
MRFLFLGLVISALASCGGSSQRAVVGVQFASGPISEACLAAGRDAASRPLCQCVQGVANQDLSARDQSRAAAFFGDPQRAQDTRQSDNPSLEAFWDRYRAWADRAARICGAVA